MGPLEYGFWGRLLHHVTVGNPYVTESSFELQKLSGNEDSHHVIHGKHIFISALARSGTTVLLREIHATGKFRSLTYRDMPFVLMPVLWRKVNRTFRKYGEEKERAHGDGVKINYDSPEAFEEVFWRTFEGKKYICDKYLKPHDISAQSLRNFQLYVGYILGSSETKEQQLYLSKNNNNILRLASIRKAFPQSIILIPFRDPLEQANSLKQQHEIFTREQSGNKFVFNYMKWLTHHEFGLTHLPFVFNPDGLQRLADYNTNDIEYWLVLWIQTYEYLLKTAPGNAIFLSYESLCKHPERTMKRIFQLAGIDVVLNGRSQLRVIPARTNNTDIDPELAVQANDLFSRLLAKASFNAM